MKVDLYERIWMYGVVVMLAAFFTSTAVAAARGGIHPPSHVETIDPRKAIGDPRFQPQGVSLDQNGHVHARVIGLTYAWMPAEMTLPSGTPVTFHVTSIDVQHGFEIAGTNGQSQIIPGYISQFTTQFDEGEYLVVCNEYCGAGHHMMAAKLHVVPPTRWTRPSVTTVRQPSAGGEHAEH